MDVKIREVAFLRDDEKPHQVEETIIFFHGHLPGAIQRPAQLYGPLMEVVLRAAPPGWAILLPEFDQAYGFLDSEEPENLQLGPLSRQILTIISKDCEDKKSVILMSHSMGALFIYKYLNINAFSNITNIILIAPVVNSWISKEPKSRVLSTAPALVINGSNDVLSCDDAKGNIDTSIRQWLPNCTTKEILHGNHMSFLIDGVLSMYRWDAPLPAHLSQDAIRTATAKYISEFLKWPPSCECPIRTMERAQDSTESDFAAG